MKKAPGAWRYLLVAAMIAAMPGCSKTPLSVRSMQVDPNATGDGIEADDDSGATHYVLQADGHGRKDVLMVFLGGSGSMPSDYTTISEYAASLGCAVLDMRFPNDRLLARLCDENDDCYADLRGETSFGAGVEYRPGQASYRSSRVDVDAANSIVGRLVSLIDYLATYGQDWNSDYWQQFLVTDANSPYVSRHFGPVYPNWPRIILAGHSQGGGDAAFIAFQLPATTPARRVVMFSTPDDNSNGVSASWITASSGTPMTRFWGMRAPDEGEFGSFVTTNWQNFGGAGSGGVGGDDETEHSVGDGSGNPRGAHRLILEASGEQLTQHNSTAANDPNGVFPPGREMAWKYLLTGGGAD